MRTLAQWREYLAGIDSHDAGEAREAVDAFARSFGPQDHRLVPELVEMLRHPHRNVRLAAVVGLQAIGPPSEGVQTSLLLARFAAR